MKRNIIILLIIFIVFSGSILLSQTDVDYSYPRGGVEIVVDDENNVEEGDERVALLFGVDEYIHDGELSYAVKDMKDLAPILKNKGVFETREYENPTLDMIKDGIDDAKNDIEDDKYLTVVFYFAGRGYQGPDDHIYFSAKDTDPYKIETTGFNLDIFVAELESLFDKVNEGRRGDEGNGLKIAVFTDSGRRPSPGTRGDVTLKGWASGEGLSLLYSTSDKTASWEIGEFRNGLFTEFLMKGLTTCEADFDNNNYVSFNEIAEYTKDKVKNWADNNGKDQVPQINNDGWKDGDFYLVECD
jgi:uncharacterized caspase-like protein